MSLSETVDEKYRIGIDDLEGRARRLVIANVSYQGVEEMRPVLHFEGMNKRLVLSASQSTDMIRMTHTAIPSDWIGESVVLRPERSGSHHFIKIDSPSARPRGFLLEGPTWVAQRFQRAFTVAAILAAIACVLWAGFRYGNDLLPLLQSWLP